ncbi:MAG: UDP-3-O-acyl-N-acetylglucosamine deacetylase [Alphaproteobacteria bacterium]|nr:UDP-3-O-acyl-N-acetylglucosamine deacetylase [Alphaproteobacteria bacterium]
MQHTLSSPITVQGIGLHSGRAVAMTLHPAPAGHGIVFERTDFSGADNRIPARWDRVTDTRLCTLISNESGASVGTVEHIMAALCGCGVDNVLITLDGPEVPVMDGSAQEFVKRIDATGLTAQAAPRRWLRILKTVTVTHGDKSASLSPAPVAAYSGEIEFPHPAIGRQAYATQLVNGNFRHELADCRTFGFMHEVEAMRAQGLALGGSLDNAIVLDRETILNPGGLRRADEFIRHKLLDAVGDLYLAGMPIMGAYHGVKAGHALNNALLRAVFADPSSYAIVNDTPATAAEHAVFA